MRHSPLNSESIGVRSSVEHHLVEAVHLDCGTDGQGSALIHSLNLHVQDTLACHAVGCLAARHLHQAAERRGLKGQAEFRRRGLGCRIGEDALSLGELLAHVWYQAAGIAKGVPVGHVVIDQLVVALNLLRGAHVRGRENLALFLDLDLLARADPLVAWAEGELVDAVVTGHEDRRPGPVKSHEAHDLVPASGPEEPCGLVPDADNRAHSPIIVHDGTAIKRIPAKHVLAIRVGLDDLGLLLGGGLADELA
mmetsp:Transcript_26395/g.73777  ORF Transcript_26395/g.73777 Transcript_26395/m.73777 type:complete len:251 (-) Transcript_26395:609-1361(-)